MVTVAVGLVGQINHVNFLLWTINELVCFHKALQLLWLKGSFMDYS